MMAQLVLDDESLRSPDRSPEWDDQLAATESAAGGRFVASVSGVERWRRAEKAPMADAIGVSLEVMGYVVHLPKHPRWCSTRRRSGLGRLRPACRAASGVRRARST